jgi:dolichyl-phosphate-mannose-protein mannosyltransferase
MSRRNQLICIALAAVFTYTAAALVLRWPLLKPYYEFHRSHRLAYFMVLHAAACLGFGLSCGVLSGIKINRAIVAGLVSGAALYLLLLFFATDHVMIAELVGNRLFYFYFFGFRAIALAAYVLASGFTLFHVLRSVSDRAASLAFMFLPVALLSVYPFTEYLPAVAVATVIMVIFSKSASLRRLLERLRAQVVSQAMRISVALASDRRFVMLIFIVAFVLRAAYAVRTASVEESAGFVWDDAVIYERGAQDFSYEGYSLFLRGVYAVFGHSYAAVGIIQSIFGALTTALIFEVARQLFDSKTARIAALISIIYGTQLFLPAMHARETLLTFLLIAAVHLTLKARNGASIYRDIGIGAVVGLLGLVKAIAFPVILPLALYRWRYSRARLHNVAALLVVGAALVASKQIVNRPLNVPVGKSTLEYAALAYFAGNHPFSSEDQWFNLSREQYLQLAAMGFNVGAGAGTQQAIEEWKAANPRIAYTDKVTFETNTWNLVRYNLRHPLEMIKMMMSNFIVLFLGAFHQHRLFDPIFLLNNSAFSMLLRIHWLALFAASSIYAFRQYKDDQDRRQKLLLIHWVVGYFTLVYTVMIGATVYSIPIIPYMLIVQSFGFKKIYEALRSATPAATRQPESDYTVARMAAVAQSSIANR